MRATYFSVVALTVLALGGCATNGASLNTSTLAADASAIEAEAQSIASATCAFVPTADTIARVVIPLVSSTSGVGSPAVDEQLAAGAAKAICGAVTAKSARRGGRFAPHVGRVAVHGRFRDGTRV